MMDASWFLHVSLFAERSYRSCGEKFITLPVRKLLILYQQFFNTELVYSLPVNNSQTLSSSL